MLHPPCCAPLHRGGSHTTPPAPPHAGGAGSRATECQPLVKNRTKKKNKERREMGKFFSLKDQTAATSHLRLSIKMCQAIYSVGKMNLNQVPKTAKSVQSLSRVRLCVTPLTAARQASLSITNSRSSLRLMSIEAVMPSSHLILCHPLFLPLSIFPSIRVFSNELVLRIRWPKYWEFQLQQQSFQ